MENLHIAPSKQEEFFQGKGATLPFLSFHSSETSLSYSFLVSSVFKCQPHVCRVVAVGGVWQERRLNQVLGIPAELLLRAPTFN